MTKALFIHDHKFIYTNNNDVYTKGQFPYQIWYRYLKHFDKLRVLGRYEFKSNIESFNLSSGPNVEHIKMERFSELKINRRILKKEIKTSDLVIVRLPSIHGLEGINIAKKLNRPYVIELVGDAFSSLWSHGKVSSKVIAPFMYLKVKKVLSEAPYVIYVTKCQLQKKYPSKKLIVTTTCSNVEIKKDYLQEIPIEKTATFKIGLIGSYTSKYKGIDSAIDALQSLINTGYNMELHILGSGDEQWILDSADKLGIKDRVVLVGSKPAGTEVFNWLQSLDLYIQPSLTEGLPRALIEAMYCGLPCIASNVGGIPELLQNEFLHKPKDVDQLKKIITRVYKDSDLRKIQSSVNHAKASEYLKEVLDRKRENFWETTINDLRKKGLI